MPVGGPYRLTAALRQVDDGQPLVAQSDIVVGVEALVVRPTVGDALSRVRHPDLIGVGVAGQRQAADDSAHTRTPPVSVRIWVLILRWQRRVVKGLVRLSRMCPVAAC